DGTAITSLGSGRLPNWSPDSSKIVFQDGSGLWVMNRDGTNRAQVRATGTTPVWSPDGQKIAFKVSTADCSATTCGLYTMNIDGTNERRLRAVPPDTIDWQACASPCPSAPAPSYDT